MQILSSILKTELAFAQAQKKAQFLTRLKNHSDLNSLINIKSTPLLYDPWGGYWKSCLSCFAKRNMQQRSNTPPRGHKKTASVLL